jgi:hypothetical protein
MPLELSVVHLVGEDRGLDGHWVRLLLVSIGSEISGAQLTARSLLEPCLRRRQQGEN